MIRPQLVFALLLLLASACGARQTAPKRRLDLADRRWLELKTPHFVMTTDVERAEAEARIQLLEQLRLALGDLYALVLGRRPPPPPGTMRVIYFASCADVEDIRARSKAFGFVTQSPDFENENLIVACDDPETHGEILLHELAHTFNDEYFGILPPWLNEGLATYYQTLVVENGQATLGRASPHYHRGAGRGPLPSLAELMAMDYQGFYQGDADYRHYFAAWKAVHLLTSTNDYQRRFRAFLNGLARGASREAAFAAAFSGVPLEKLGFEYHRYPPRDGMQIWTAPYALKPAPAASVRELGAADGHAIAIELDLIRLHANPAGSKDVSPVLDRLRRAEKEVPAWPGVLFWRAVVAHEFGGELNDAPEPEELLRQYLEKVPEDGRAWLGLLRVGYERAAKGKDAERLKSLEEAVTVLAKIATTAAEFAEIARYLATRNEPKAALAFADAALERNATCIRCRYIRAALLSQLGRPAEAAVEQERAIHLGAEVGVPPSWHELLQTYQAQAGSQPAAPAARP